MLRLLAASLARGAPDPPASFAFEERDTPEDAPVRMVCLPCNLRFEIARAFLNLFREPLDDTGCLPTNLTLLPFCTLDV